MRYDGTSGVAWMPDGRRFIFGRALQRQRTLWSAAADGSDPRQLTSEGTAAWPAVSADGRSRLSGLELPLIVHAVFASW